MHELSSINPTTQQRMTSLEIADLTGKRHDHVMRDIKSLIDQDAIGAPNFGETFYTDKSNRQAPMYKLDFKSTMVLITGYDAKRRAMVIDRWIALETGQAEPKLGNKNPIDIPKLVKKFKACKQIAKTAGLKGQDAVVYANSIMQKNYGEDPLALLGLKNMGKASYTQVAFQTEKSINDFIDQYCITGEDYKVKFKVIYGGLEVWWKKNSSRRVPTPKKLGAELGKRFERVKHGIIWYYGVDLKKIGGA